MYFMFKMGIKHFFTWFRTTFPEYINRFVKTNPPENVQIDTFMIDLNGIFHTSAQKIYKYGNYAEQRRLLRGPPNMQKDFLKLQTKCFEHVCQTIEELVNVTNPRKELVLCIDGVAPQSKQNQQRQRRYRGAVEDPENFFNTGNFDQNCITPGTKFMDYLSKYIDWYIRKRINESDKWKSINVVFSNEKVPGEGEHKLVNYIRKYGSDDNTYCINALDADLFMLSLATHKQKIYLLREDMYTRGSDYMYVDIGGVRKELTEKLMYWEGCNKIRVVNDFILICFMCGNDFLPNIPSIAIMEKGLDTIVDIYKMTCVQEGHLTSSNLEFRPKSLGLFLKLIGNSEKGLLINKIIHKNEYLSDPLLEKWDAETFDFEKYREEYYAKKSIPNVEKICHQYLNGFHWVLTYYVKGISDWTWMFPCHYSPFATDLAMHVESFVLSPQKVTHPLLPFQQLLCVLPPKSHRLVPQPLDNLMTTPSPISRFSPDTFNINYEGKREKWEGIVELPIVDFEIVKKTYCEVSHNIQPQDMKRNIIGKSFIYKFSGDFFTDFKSFYGNINNCCVQCDAIEF